MADGFLGFLGKNGSKRPETPERLEHGLGNIKEELKKQDTWLRYLHNYSTDIHKYATSINESNVKHKKEILAEINKLNRWVSYLYEGNNSVKEELSTLKTELKKTLRSDFEMYHRTIEEYLSLKFEEERQKKESMKSDILTELKLLLKSEERINNAETQKPVNSIMHYNLEKELSNPEKDLLSLLFNENKPMTYEEISKKLNKSLNSTRVYMNSLRQKKQIIEEFTTKAGIKVFSIKNSELVKTLFNLN